VNIVSVVGARPQFVKLKPINDAFVNQQITHSVIHTGQHYDSNMSEIFFRGLDLPNPKFNLEIGQYIVY
jgi:UDP-N-acetylglucosamine 2-epimerase (non-hydrolysing)